MSRRFDEAVVWSRDFAWEKGRKARMKARDAARRRRGFAQRLNGMEQLEERQLLAADAGASGAMSPAAIQQAYGQAPVSFEANQGQTASQVDYLARGAGYTLYLTGSGAVLDLQPLTSGSGGSSDEVSGTVIDMQFVGANANATVTGLDKQQTVSNYFVGSDPSQWHTGIANYGQVEYQNLYSGISATFHGSQRQLEYDFNIAPGADPNQIQWQITGASGLSIDSSGNLLIHTAGGDLMEKAPNIYQNVNGTQVAVSGHFVLAGSDRVGFAVGSYDTSLPLVIDPTIVYSTYLGGSGADYGYGVAVDSSGNAYVTGYTNSTNFPTTAGAYQTAYAGNEDAFVTKLNAAGSGLLYSTYLGGSSADSGYGIAVDDAGEAYVIGATASTDFPTTVGAYQTALSGTQDAFVTKLDATGGALAYSTYLGGSSSATGQAIVVNSSDNAYVTGYTNSADFPTTAGAYQTTSGGGIDAFVTELNAAGSALIYSTYLGGSGTDEGYGIALDSSDNAYITGDTQSTNFPTTAGAFQTAYGGNGDAFVTELNAAGSSLEFSTYLGGSQDDRGRGIVVDGSGNVYVDGMTGSSDFPTTVGAFQTVFGGGDFDAFATKLNAGGGSLIYSTYLGTPSIDEGYALAVNDAGDAFIVGRTNATNFPTTPGAFQTTVAGSFDVFLTQLNALGDNLLYSTYLGGSSVDTGYGVALDSPGNVYLTGNTDSSDFPVTAGAYQTLFNGSGLDGAGDAFVSKFLTAATHNQQFINQLYTDLLGRNVDPDGLSYWDAQLAAGVARTQVALSIQQTLEYAQDTVETLYSRYLHRAADPGGLSFFSQLFLQGVTVEQMSAMLAGSTEFYT
ncbi:MAG TPA: SBBP repeat-containing protein, partial [Pirellulales bacterium]|nr:SBBP repeat-containing protein [Pirellulales bacterium]